MAWKVLQNICNFVPFNFFYEENSAIKVMIYFYGPVFLYLCCDSYGIIKNSVFNVKDNRRLAFAKNRFRSLM